MPGLDPGIYQQPAQLRHVPPQMAGARPALTMNLMSGSVHQFACRTVTAGAKRKGGAMTAPEGYQWRRDKDGLGVWEHRGKVAVAGVGHSPVDRRWDGVSMDQTLGAYSILACRKAMDEAGVTPDQIDGVICCDSHIAGGSGGSASQWAPRPYFAPPYDSEWGLTLINAKWLVEQMGLPHLKFSPTGVPTNNGKGGLAAHALGGRRCPTPLA